MLNDSFRCHTPYCENIVTPLQVTVFFSLVVCFCSPTVSDFYVSRQIPFSNFFANCKKKQKKKHFQWNSGMSAKKIKKNNNVQLLFTASGAGMWDCPWMSHKRPTGDLVLYAAAWHDLYLWEGRTAQKHINGQWWSKKTQRGGRCVRVCT